MSMGAYALALWCTVLCAVVSRTATYTVDCNHEYTDCDTELSKLANDEEDGIQISPATDPSVPQTSTNVPPTRSTTTAKSEINETEVDAVRNTVDEIFTTPTEPTVKPKPRLLNLNVEELQNFANTLHNQTNNGDNKRPIPDLSDINLDGDDDDETLKQFQHEHKLDKDIPEKFYSNLQAPFHPLMAMDRSEEMEITCKENGVVYKIGEKIDRECEETCECSPRGIFDCSERCKHPFIRRGRRLTDPLCFESPVDDCCSIIACATGNGDKPVKVEVCRFGNDTYPVGVKWNIGCEQSCICEKNSIVTCKPRCKKPPASDKCINVQDPADACCEIQVCDVSQDVHEEPTENGTSVLSTERAASESGPMESPMRPLVLTEPIGSVTVLQNNTVQVNLMHPNNSEDPIHLLLSSDAGKTYNDVELKYSNLILNLEGGRDYILKTKETGTKFNFTMTVVDSGNDMNEIMNDSKKIGCYEEGQFYAVGEEFRIGCTELCECTGPDTRECAKLECPSHVGLELVSKGCVRWAPNPPPVPPDCCPRTARCLSDGTCHFKGHAVPNWSEVPVSLTGCEQRCFCENGDLDCQEVCSPLPPIPPQTLRCPPMHHPAAVNISDDDCCKKWGCVSNNGQASQPDFPFKPTPPQEASFLPTLPPETPQRFPQEDILDIEQNNIHRPLNPIESGLPAFPPGFPPNHGEENKKLTVISLQADSPTSIKMLFGLPPVLVGLRGNVDLRYTDKTDEDVSHWYSQVFAPADEVLTTSRLEFRLTGLKPSTVYKVRGKLYLHNLPVEPESEVFTVRTQDMPTLPPIEEKRREIDSKLTVVDVNDTTARVTWRYFTEDELQFIDGIQVRYRPVGTPIYIMTELLHHSRSTAELHELRPGSSYEASMVLIPPPRAMTELYDPGRVEFTTSPYVDPYNWSVVIEARAIGAHAAEVRWWGPPAPPERWVRVYRAAHACSGKSEQDAFRLAARDMPPTITLTGLEPDTRCRIWLELFLTNGKIKTSNVLEINTKPENSNEPIDNEIASASIASGGRGSPRGDYYGALVAVGVVAALGALTSLLLLLIVVRRHRPRSVSITQVPSAPRESSLPPYDNPAYKLELQQETMDL